LIVSGVDICETLAQAMKPKTNGEPGRVEVGTEFVLRQAVLSDVEAIHRLINYFARTNLMLPRGPQYIYENLRDYIVCSFGQSRVNEQSSLGSTIVACGSLHVLWHDQAEIRSLAVDSKFQGRDIGKRIVELLIEEARRLGFRKVYSFTMQEEFFRKMGFTSKQKDELPSKLWGECSQCPKYFNCDEVGLVLDLICNGQ